MAVETQSPVVLRFGAFELDLRAGELHKQGLRVKLQEQPFRVLAILLQQPGGLVTRDELRSKIWPADTFVDFDNSLNTSINKLREALGDSADSPRFIETLPRRGYRFIAPVTGDGLKNPVVNTGRRKFAVGVAMAATALAVVAGGLVWFAKRHSSSPPEMKLRQLTTNSFDNPVRTGSISSDGQRLAYADPKRMYIKLIETGEIRVVAEPEALKNQKITWQIVCWFPDGTRFMVNAHPAGTGGEEWNSRNTSIWIVSVLGEPPHKVRDQGNAYAVSPDGSLIAFGMNPGRFGDREIWLMDSNGEHPRKLLESNSELGIDTFLWSPDGQRVSYIRHNDDFSEFKIISQVWKDGHLGDAGNGVPADITPWTDMKNVYDGLELPGERAVFSVGEPGSVNETCNFWTVRLDPRTGKPIENARQVTHWGGYCMSNLSVTKSGKLAFLRWQTHTSTYVANIEAVRAHIDPPQHLTKTESLDYPVGWTADSKAVLIASSRAGHWGIYKQFLNQDTPESLVTATDDVRTTAISADGNWFLFGVRAKPGNQSSNRNVMRVPITGGPPQLVYTARPHSQILCARSPSILCLIGEPTEDRKQIIFATFDPLKGLGAEVTRFDLDPNEDNWAFDLSADGTRIAATRRPDGPIYILSLSGHPTQEIKVKGGRKGILGFNWAANGKGLYVSSEAPGGAELLYVDFQGNSQVLWKNSAGNFTAGLPSPDGLRLAIAGLGFDGNIWMMENF